MTYIMNKRNSDRTDQYFTADDRRKLLCNWSFEIIEEDLVGGAKAYALVAIYKSDKDEVESWYFLEEHGNTVSQRVTFETYAQLRAAYTNFTHGLIEKRTIKPMETEDRL